MKALILAPICLAACSSSEVVVGDLQEVASVPAVPNRDLDLLFVVDNSPSMLPQQQSLATNFRAMIELLDTVQGGRPNLHIGVVTSDLGTSGSHTAPADSIGAGQGACTGTGMGGNMVAVAGMADHFLSDIGDSSGVRTTNYTGALADEFAQLALVGDQGCGFEQHLGAMRRALDNNPNNTGFLRPDANLAVVVVANEDDCSVGDSAFFGSDPALGPLQSFRCTQWGVECDEDITTVGAKTNCHPSSTSPYLDDVQPFSDFLVALKGDARKVMVAGILGDPTPVAVELAAPPGGGTPIATLSHSCTYAGPDGPETADPAVRLASFLGAFPGRSRLTSICSLDLTDALDDIAMSAMAMMAGDPCLDADVLADSCNVTDVRDSAPDQPIHLPRCADGGATCFDLVPDATTCPNTSQHLRLQIHRDVDPAADTWTHVRCQPR